MAGLGPILANSGTIMRGFNEGMDEADTRAYLKRLRETGVRKLDNEDALMPDNFAAQRAKLGLATASDTADTALVGPKARLAATNTAVAQGTADNTLGHLGMFLDTKNTEQMTAATNAKTDLLKAGFNHDDVPRQIAKAKQAGAIDDVQTADLALGGLGHSLALNDKATVKKYLQDSADYGFAPQLKGKQIGDIGTGVGADGKPALVVQDTDGNTLTAIPAAAITAAYSRMNPAKFQVLPDGAQLFRETKSGAEKVAENTKDFKPAERAKDLDQRMTRGKAIIDSYFGANSLNKLEEANQPKYESAIKRMGELVRSGVNPEEAATTATAEMARAAKLNPAGTPAAAAAGGTTPAPYTPWK